MKRLLVLICTCFLIFPLIAYSQAPPERIEFAPWWDRPIVRDLGLSEDQLQQIRAIVRDSRDQLIQLQATVRIAENRLVDAMSDDIGSAPGAIENVVQARGDLMRATSQMSLKIRQVLTSSQWQELRRRGAQRILPPLQRRARARAGQPPLP